MKEIEEAFFDLRSNRTQKSQKEVSDEINVTSNSNAQNKKIIEDYIIKDTIGKGTFSVVKLGEHIKTKKKVAIKILDKEKIKSKEDLTRIKREIKILSILDHPNIIKTYKISETPKKYYIIMEYCEGGELFDYIVEKERLDEFESSIFFYQLINALDYIHSKGIAHRDLKPENLSKIFLNKTSFIYLLMMMKRKKKKKQMIKNILVKVIQIIKKKKAKIMKFYSKKF